jgi:hypothetical protein
VLAPRAGSAAGGFEIVLDAFEFPETALHVNAKTDALVPCHVTNFQYNTGSIQFYIRLCWFEVRDVFRTTGWGVSVGLVTGISVSLPKAIVVAYL